MRRDLDDVPNPFSIEQLATRSRPRHSLRGAVKAFLIIAFSLVVLLSASTLYQRHRVANLQSDFGSLPSAEKLQQLDQLPAHGTDALASLADALCDDSDDVASQAHAQLRDLQQSWTVLRRAEAVDHQKQFVAAIEAIDERLPVQRVDLVQQLLQHTIRSSVDQSNPPMRKLYFAATAAMQRLSARVEQDRASMTTGDVRNQPLPLAHLAGGVDWTNWPPASLASLVDSDAATPTESKIVQASFRTPRPTVYRGEASSLKAVPDSEVVLLRDVHDGRTINVSETETVEAPHLEVGTVPGTVDLIELNIQSVDIRTVISSLATPEVKLQNQAVAELARRGFNEDQISIATKIAGVDSTAKVSLIETLVARSDIDPRPWLIMLLRDESRQVRLRAITALAKMKDPWVAEELGLRMVEETDQTVAQRIRSVLNLR